MKSETGKYSVLRFTKEGGSRVEEAIAAELPLTVIVKIMLEHTEDLRPLAILLGPADPDSPARSRPSTARAAIPPHGRGE
ncbi:MAG: hypothetical protein QGG14_02285 [Planctomycetota bacterium]|nr:hypothetical protein [Planctomycetota bacterium]